MQTFVLTYRGNTTTANKILIQMPQICFFNGCSKDKFLITYQGNTSVPKLKLINNEY